MKTISVINQKGGCGKTTTSINLAAVLASRGQRTVLVDLDPQSHCAAGLGVPEPRIDLDIGDALRAGCAAEPDRLLWPVSRCLDLAPSRMTLAGLEAPGGGIVDKPDKELRLARVLDDLSDRFDVAIIDCSPSIGLLTFNALLAADAALVPVETSFFSLQGATKQLSTVRSLTKRLGREVRAWLVPTLHDTDSSLCEDLLDELRRRFGSKVVPVVIRRDQVLKESASFGQPVIEYDPQSTGSEDYVALGDWVLGHLSDLPDRAAPSGAPAAPGHAVVRASSEPSEGLAQRVFSNASTQLESMHDRARTLATRLADRARGTTEQPTDADGVSSQEVAEAQRRLFGAQSTTSGVLFVQPLALGDRVCVVADFNGWQPIAMTRNDALQVFELCLPLDEGEHRYRLDVDGHRLADPYNTEWQLDEQGHPNSVVRVLHAGSPQTTLTSP